MVSYYNYVGVYNLLIQLYLHPDHHYPNYQYHLRYFRHFHYYLITNSILKIHYFNANYLKWDLITNLNYLDLGLLINDQKINYH